MSSFDFDGTNIAFEPGDSVASALVAAGVNSWRETHVAREPRGIFCGIGVCYDCLVVADGRAGMRACLLQARDGMRVQPMRVEPAHD